MQAWWEVKIDDHLEEESGITPELRLMVLHRDKFRCQYCGTDDIDALTVHHVIYRSRGGGHSMANLVTLCGTCHQRIHQRMLFVTRVDGWWYFRDIKLNKEFHPHDTTDATNQVAHLRLRRYARGSSDRWRSVWERYRIHDRHR